MESKVLTIEECKEREIYLYSFDNGDYKYKDSEGYYHLIRNDIDLLKGKKVKYCWSYPNGDYKYQDSYGIWYYIKKEPKT